MQLRRQCLSLSRYTTYGKTRDDKRRTLVSVAGHLCPDLNNSVRSWRRSGSEQSAMAAGTSVFSLSTKLPLALGEIPSVPEKDPLIAAASPKGDASRLVSVLPV
jgi:hypothetical protein